MSQTLEKKLTQRELADRWGWSMTLLTRMVNAHEIPHLRIGGKVFFELSALESWLAQRRQGTAPPVSVEAEPFYDRMYRD